MSSRRSLVQYVKSLVEAGVMKRPLWLKAMEKVPPPPLPKPSRRPPRITYPEDEMIASFYHRHPEAKLEPLDLSSFEPPTVRRFVNLQMDLMQKGLSKEESRNQVELEFFGPPDKSAPKSSLIEDIQAEEERHLQEGVVQYLNSQFQLEAGT